MSKRKDESGIRVYAWEGLEITEYRYEQGKIIDKTTGTEYKAIFPKSYRSDSNTITDEFDPATTMDEEFGFINGSGNFYKTTVINEKGKKTKQTVTSVFSIKYDTNLMVNMKYIGNNKDKANSQGWERNINRTDPYYT